MTNTTMPTTNGSMIQEKAKAARGSIRAAKRKATSRVVKSASYAAYGKKASQLLARGKKAAGGAIEWAREGAGRNLPRAAAYVPDRHTVEYLAKERPYVLGAIGVGIGVIIGMMLPARVAGAAAALRHPPRRAGR